MSVIAHHTSWVMGLVEMHFLSPHSLFPLSVTLSAFKLEAVEALPLRMPETMRRLFVNPLDLAVRISKLDIKYKIAACHHDPNSHPPPTPTLKHVIIDDSRNQMSKSHSSSKQVSTVGNVPIAS